MPGQDEGVEEPRPNTIFWDQSRPLGDHWDPRIQVFVVRNESDIPVNHRPNAIIFVGNCSRELRERCIQIYGGGVPLYFLEPF